MAELGVRRSVIERLHAAGCVYADDEAALLLDAAPDPDELDRLVARRSAGTPLEHVLGRADFYGLPVAVAAGVFVPRRRTELVVAEAVRLAGGRSCRGRALLRRGGRGHRARRDA